MKAEPGSVGLTVDECAQTSAPAQVEELRKRIEQAGGQVLSAYREFLPAAPRDLNGFFAFATVPPGDPFPPEIHLREVCGVVWCHTGDEAAAARDMQPLLDALPEPLLHGVQPMPYPMLQSAFDALYPKGDQWYWRADFVKDIPDEAVAIHQRWGEHPHYARVAGETIRGFFYYKLLKPKARKG